MNQPWRVLRPEAKRLRAEGLTYKAIGECLGVSEQTASRWVRTEAAPLKKAYYIVNDETGCWEWQRVDSNGYGSLCTKDTQSYPAHRFFYEEKYGPVPPDLVLDHLCGNRCCVNLEHLEAVPQALNVQRGRGAKLTEQFVREIRDLAGVMTFTEIGHHYGITWGGVQKVVERWAWRNVA